MNKMMASEFAPAKINLALHVTGRRDDGYHLLDSLVAFTDIGDQVAIAPSDEMALTVTGPKLANVPCDARNLAWRAAEQFEGQSVHIHLEKHLPAQAGIGGGSADAAAVVRLMQQKTGQRLSVAAQTKLGADVPVCVLGKAARMRGIGDELTLVDQLPCFPIVLVNCGISIATPTVFAALESRNNPPLKAFPTGTDQATWLAWLRQSRNDLEAPAMAISEQISQSLKAISAQKGCMYSRMSGSGATCFGLFETTAAADDAANRLAKTQPNWWVQAGMLNPS